MSAASKSISLFWKGFIAVFIVTFSVSAKAEYYFAGDPCCTQTVRHVHHHYYHKAKKHKPKPKVKKTTLRTLKKSLQDRRLLCMSTTLLL